MVVVDMLDRILDSLSEALMHKMLNLHLPLLSKTRTLAIRSSSDSGP